MMHTVLRRLAPFAMIALGAGLTGCSADINFSSDDGVPLADLDLGGDAPVELVLAGADKVIISESDTLTITVEGDDDAVAAVRFERDGPTLAISREDDSWGGSESATIFVGMPNPREITIGGSGEVKTATMASNAAVVIGGSGSMTIDQIDAEKFDIAIGGSGSIRAAGTADRLEIAIGGSGNANLAELNADDADIVIGGSGSVSLASDGEVKGSIGGSGRIDVTGTAQCTLDSVGSGSLNCSPGTQPASETAEPAEDTANEE